MMTAQAAAQRTDGDLCLLDTMGPLASMHAALDAVGAGIPCGIIARFEGRGVAEVEAAVQRTALAYPLLRQRLLWRDDRVWSLAEPPLAPCGSGFSLLFKVGPEGRPWSYALEAAGDDVVFKAVFAHAIADGFSMLHFLAAVARSLVGAVPAPIRPVLRAATTPRAFASWLPDFVGQQCRRFSTPAAQTDGPGITGTTIPPDASARLLNAAREAGIGFGSLLAGAASLAYAQTSRTPFACPVLLNVQVLRSRLEALNGFGFGAGSVMMPVTVGASDDPFALAATISARARRLVDEGWDGNLNRLIGRDPRRHLAMARLRSRQTCDPTLTVSWKARPLPPGGLPGLRDIACFAASRGSHVSAHLDDDGLSLSLTDRQPEAARVATLDALLCSLGVRAEARCLHPNESAPDLAGAVPVPPGKTRLAWTWPPRRAGAMPLTSGPA